MAVSILQTITPHLRGALLACGLVLLGLALAFAFCAEGPALRCADETGAVPPATPGDGDLAIGRVGERDDRHDRGPACTPLPHAPAIRPLPLLI